MCGSLIAMLNRTTYDNVCIKSKTLVVKSTEMAEWFDTCQNHNHKTIDRSAKLRRRPMRWETSTASIQNLQQKIGAYPIQVRLSYVMLCAFFDGCLSFSNFHNHHLVWEIIHCADCIGNHRKSRAFIGIFRWIIPKLVRG